MLIVESLIRAARSLSWFVLLVLALAQWRYCSYVLVGYWGYHRFLLSDFWHHGRLRHDVSAASRSALACRENAEGAGARGLTKDA